MRAVCAVAAAACVIACAGTNTSECADGSTCPAGKVCAPIVVGIETITFCVDREQLDRCKDVASGAACGDGATCHDGVCLADDCGNSLRDSSEACDDGNRVSGDNCSDDCRSNETCSNGRLDGIRGEQCDDGNTLGHDGCATTCIAESLRWELISSARPVGRTDYAIAYDSHRRRSVIFGGVDENGGVLGDTAEWRGASGVWVAPSSLIAPLPRRDHAIAYDATRHVIVLFGGFNGTTFGDTWEWNGTWTQRASPLAPSARSGHAMAYDHLRHAVVLFGGSDHLGNVQQDTWLWNGVAWTELGSSTMPSARREHAMAYDAQQGAIVMFGGSNGAALGDTWRLGSSGWSQQSPPTAPGARAHHAMAFDATSGTIVLAGGSTAGIALRDTWRWNGTAATWTRVADLPATMQRHALASDPDRERIVLMDTHIYTSPSLDRFGDLYEWTGTGWTAVDKQGALQLDDVFTPRYAPATAFDLVGRRFILFGGHDGDFTSARDDTWVWDGRQLVAELGLAPSPRSGAAMAYDAARGNVVLFGGVRSNGTALADTWTWTDTKWAPVTTTPSPPARGHHVMVYDAKRRAIVLTGGHNGAVPLGDTWTWNGTSWQSISGLGPPPRSHAAAAYDPIRQRVVIAGGIGSTGSLADVWELDGDTWADITQSGGAIAPAARFAASLAWDPARRRLVLFGGQLGNASSGVVVADTWEARHDGELIWEQPSVSTPFEGRFGHVMFHDFEGAGLVLFGGSGVSGGVATDIWRLRWDGPAPYELCEGVDSDLDGATGCDDDDCWARCHPLCMPEATACEQSSRCGDGTCNPVLESCYLCPGDCGTCPETCGNFVCETAEMSSCPGDCP